MGRLAAAVAALAACCAAPAARAEAVPPSAGTASSAVSPASIDGSGAEAEVGPGRQRTFVALDAARPDEPGVTGAQPAAVPPASPLAEQQVMAIPFPPAARLLVPGTAMAAWAVYRFGRPRRARAVK